MQQQSFTKPHYIFFIVMASGISQGFFQFTFPYLLTQKGFSDSYTSDILALGLTANICRFLWGPFIDLSLSLKKWFWISTFSCIVTLMWLCIIPYNVKETLWIWIVAFLSQIAATFVLAPVSGLMAKRIDVNKKSTASGWFQAGNFGGIAFGGGLGLWLAAHYNIFTSGIVLSIISLLFSLIIFKIDDVPHSKEKTIKIELAEMAKDIFTMIKIPIVLFIILLICLPIGTGAFINLLTAVAKDWHVGVNTIALVTGVLFSFVSAVGSVAGGFITHRLGNWKSYLGFGTIYAIVCGGMAAFPYIPIVYIIGVLVYAFVIGMMNAVFTSTLLFASGKKNAATKFSVLVSLGNLPFVYMTAVDGWVHDKHSSKYMLLNEAALCLLSVLICIIILKWMQAKKMILKTID